MNQLRSDKIIKGLLAHGKKVFLKNWTVYLNLNKEKGLRLAVRTPRQTGPAHERNRIKRVAREFFREKASIFEGYDLLIISRWGSKNPGLEKRPSNKELVEEWELFFKQFSKNFSKASL